MRNARRRSLSSRWRRGRRGSLRSGTSLPIRREQALGGIRCGSLPRTVTGTAFSRMRRSVLPPRRRTSECMPRSQPLRGIARSGCRGRLLLHSRRGRQAEPALSTVCSRWCYRRRRCERSPSATACPTPEGAARPMFQLLVAFVARIHAFGSKLVRRDAAYGVRCRPYDQRCGGGAVMRHSCRATARSTRWLV